MNPILALSMRYGGIPDSRQAVIGGIIFFAIYALPLFVMHLSLHRMPDQSRRNTDLVLAIFFTFLALATPGGMLLEGAGLFFAVIGLAASIDLLHLRSPLRGIGLLTGLLSGLVLFSTVESAFRHAILSSYRY